MKDKILKTITESYPYSLSTVENIFNKLQSYDLTIKALEMHISVGGHLTNIVTSIKEKQTFNKNAGWGEVKIQMLGQEIEVDSKTFKMYNDLFKQPNCINAGLLQRIENLQNLLKNALTNEDYVEAQRIKVEIEKLKS